VLRSKRLTAETPKSQLRPKRQIPQNVGPSFWSLRCHGRLRSLGVSAIILISLAAFAHAESRIILQHPQDQTVQGGEVAHFEISVDKTHPAAYQWQMTPPGSSNFADIAGATAAFYNSARAIPALGGARYRCRVSQRTSEVISRAAVLTVQSVSGKVLPSPILTLPSSIPVTGDLTAHYPPGYPKVFFEWSVMPADDSAKLVTQKPITDLSCSAHRAASSAQRADFQSLNGTASLAKYGLMPGVYNVTVWAFDGPGHRSVPAQAEITLVEAERRNPGESYAHAH
jgi:hypothetical protein